MHQADTLNFVHALRLDILQRMEKRETRNRSALSLLSTNTVRIACVLSVVVLCAVSAFSQSTFGSILGTVEDNTGAVIPGVTITAHSLDENEDHVTTSNASGEFVFENLKAGHYKVTVRKDGFTDSVVSSATLEARQELRLPVTLAVTAATTTVEVSADAELINTENGTINNTIANVDITQLPINSRSVSSSPLAALAVSPEVTRDSQGNFAVGGATAAQTGFSVDGISTANIRYNGALQDTYPSLESIDEMKVTAFDNNAEFAQMGDVTFTTKSGTNKLHGSAFEYFQNNDLDATVLNFPVKAPRIFNTFGGSLGGPVTVPRLYNGRDKTFFFADYEGNRKTQSYPEELLVPSAADWAGNLNDLVQSLGKRACDQPVHRHDFHRQHHPHWIVPGLHQSGGSGSDELLPPAQRQQPVLQLSGPRAEPLELQRLRCPRRSQFQ